MRPRSGRRRHEPASKSRLHPTAELQSADLVLAMDRQTELFLLSLSASTQVQLLGSYDDSAHGAEIPDPYGADDEVYRATLDRIITAAEALVASLAD